MASKDLGPVRHWQRLQLLATRFRGARGADLLAEQNRLTKLSLQLDCLCVDWSHQFINQEIFDCLVALGTALKVNDQLASQFAGEIVNTTESRPAVHTAMRGTSIGNKHLDSLVAMEYDNVCAFVNDVHEGTRRSFSDELFTDLLHVGIGGSHLGQVLACDALPNTFLKPHFLTNPNSIQVRRSLRDLNPNTTLVVFASKSFRTTETLEGFKQVASWLVERSGNADALKSNTVAISANKEALQQFPGSVFSIPLGVGGRFSLWSAMGLPVLLACGVPTFTKLRAGAQFADQHATSAEIHENVAAILALLAVWNTNFRGAGSHACLVYAEELRLLPAYLQQLSMESLGKTVHNHGEPTKHHTGTLVWGGLETEGQHAFHQWLLQGSRRFSADFIASLDAQSSHDEWVLSNCLAQQELLLAGHSNKDPHKAIQGGNGSTLFLLDRIEPWSIGILLALLEHTVACQGYLWSINPFDQWGVEAGKNLADSLVNARKQPQIQRQNTLQIQRLRKIAQRQNNLNKHQNG